MIDKPQAECQRISVEINSAGLALFNIDDLWGFKIIRNRC